MGGSRGFLDDSLLESEHRSRQTMIGPADEVKPLRQEDCNRKNDSLQQAWRVQNRQLEAHCKVVSEEESAEERAHLFVLSSQWVGSGQPSSNANFGRAKFGAWHLAALARDVLRVPCSSNLYV